MGAPPAAHAGDRRSNAAGWCRARQSPLQCVREHEMRCLYRPSTRQRSMPETLLTCLTIFTHACFVPLDRERFGATTEMVLTERSRRVNVGPTIEVKELGASRFAASSRPDDATVSKGNTKSIDGGICTARVLAHGHDRESLRRRCQDAAQLVKRKGTYGVMDVKPKSAERWAPVVGTGQSTGG